MVTTKKAAAAEKKKGELMENDQDAMEVMEVSCVSITRRRCASMKARILLGFFHLLGNRHLVI